MSGDITNGDLLRVLMGIREDVGSLKSTAESTKDWLDSHVAEDHQRFAALDKDVTKLQLDQAKQSGATRVWGLMATAAGTIAGIVVSYFHKN